MKNNNHNIIFANGLKKFVLFESVKIIITYISHISLLIYHIKM